MMKIVINGEGVSLENATTLEAVLQQQGYGDMTVAAALNGHFVARSSYGATAIKDGDEIEIVAPMQGG